MEHGRRSTYTKKGCRCEVCRETEREYRAQYRAGVRATFPIKHGTVWAYRALACRCEPCTRANTDRVFADRVRRLAVEVPGRAHGTLGGYVNWSCRCERCKAANAIASQSKRDRVV